MAEFCLDCWNKMHHTDFVEKEARLSRTLTLCEGCGDYKRVLEDMPFRKRCYKQKSVSPMEVFFSKWKKQFDKSK